MTTDPQKKVSIKGKTPIAKARITLTHNKRVESFNKDIPLREVTQMFEDLIGDGNATISLTGTVGSMDYGNGFTVQLFTSVSVNQDDATMAMAAHALADFTLGLLPKIAAQANEMYQDLRDGK